eukprot:scaffold1211_cov169-Amphora_coffeaeformis.AAC.17
MSSTGGSMIYDSSIVYNDRNGAVVVGGGWRWGAPAKRGLFERASPRRRNPSPQQSATDAKFFEKVVASSQIQCMVYGTGSSVIREVLHP